jgi:hypothetical protein
MTAQELNDKIHALCKEAMDTMDRRQIMQVMSYQTFSMYLAHSVSAFMNNPEALEKMMEKVGAKMIVAEDDEDFLDKLRKERRDD